jgi:hypothetical protein
MNCATQLFCGMCVCIIFTICDFFFSTILTSSSSSACAESNDIKLVSIMKILSLSTSSFVYVQGTKFIQIHTHINIYICKLNSKTVDEGSHFLFVILLRRLNNNKPPQEISHSPKTFFFFFSFTENECEKKYNKRVNETPTQRGNKDKFLSHTHAFSFT